MPAWPWQAERETDLRRAKALCRRSVEAAPMRCSQMIGNDQFDTLAERLLHRIAKQRGRGMVPANDRSRGAGTDDSVGDLIENPLSQFGLLFHECTPAIVG